MKRIITLLVIGLFLFSACSDQEKAHKDHAGKEKETVNYTCPMHPQIVQHGPGTCPICGMDLVPVNAGGAEPGLMLNESQVALANISTMAIGTGTLDQYKRLNGRLVTDPQSTVFVSSRAAGRVDQLYVKETGVAVRKGQPLYRIYSEQLAALQQEYLVTAAQSAAFPDNARFQQIAAAARQKLLLYNVPAQTLDRIQQQRKTDPYLTYASPVNGIIASLSVTEGQYVGEGSTILQLENYDALWVAADVYPAELSQVKTGQSVKVTVSGWENEPVDMKIDFITPALETGTQLAQVRGVIRNPDHRWQPGMQANILLPSATNSNNVLTLPTDAVIRDGKGAHVWIKKGAEHFMPRKVKTGAETFDQVAITEGLQAGDTVVTTGAYLLYSEYILKKGANPMAATHAH